MKKLTKIKNLEKTQIWTPEEQVNLMIDFIELPDWTGYTLVDICAGTGNMLTSAYKRHPEARFIGVEIDPVVYEELKENAPFAETHLSDIENFDLSETEKVIVLLNPPYQNGNRSVYLEWIRYTLDVIKPDRSSYIVPSRWMYGIYEKGDHEFVKWLYEHTNNIHFITGDSVFDGINVGEVVIFSISDNTKGLKYIEINNKYIYDDGMLGNIYTKLKAKTKEFMYDKIQNYNHTRKINEVVSDKRTILFDKSNGYFKGIDRMDGGPYDYIYIPKGEIYKDNRIMLEINDDVNLSNLKNYLKSDLVNYLFSYMAVTKNSNILHYSFIPWLDFNLAELGNYTDKYLYKYFNLSAEEIDHINNELERFRESQKNKNSKTRRKKINLSKLGIKNGDLLTWIKDDSVEFVVEDAKRNTISRNGETLSISKMAQLYLELNRPVQGTLFFKYKGIKLSQLHNKT